MPTIALLGADAPHLGEVAVGAAAGVAAGLSAGRFPKAMPSIDPNEDAVLVVADGDVVLLGIADGHNGAVASHAAIRALAHLGERLLQESIETVIEIARAAAERAIEGSPEAGTSLTVARREAGRCSVVTVGDSRALSVGRRVRFLDSPSPFWNATTIGAPLPSVREHRFGDDWLVVASDGLLDFLGRDVKGRIAALVGGSPEESVRRLIDAALEGAAGDHVSCAVAGSLATVRPSH